jgi:zinc protease
MKTSWRLSLVVLFAGCASGGQNGHEPPPPTPEATPVPETTATTEPAVPFTEGKGDVVTLPIEGTAAVAVKVLFYTGSADDPPTKEGLTMVTARLIAEGGSASMTYPEILKAFYPMSTELQVQVDKEQTVFSLLVHKDHVQKLAPILGEILSKPRLGEKDFERIRRDLVDDIEKRLRATDDENLGKELLNQMLYPAGHPYHHSVLGTIEGLKAMTAADVKAHYARVFGKRRMLIGIAGAVDDAVRSAIVGALSGIGEGEPRLASIPRPPPVAKNEVLIVQKSAKAVAVSMGAPHGAFRGHPDFAELALVQSYFGEHRQFHGILMSEMREKRGLNYGDYAYVESFIQEGWSRDVRTNISRRRQHFSMWIRPVDPKDAVFAIRLALFLRDRLVKQGITPEGLDQTQQFLTGYTRLWELTPLRKLGWTLDSRFYGIEGDYLESYRARIGKLTKGEIDAAIKKHLSTPLKIAIVAEDAEGLRARLLSGERSKKEYGAKPPEDVPALDAEMAGFPLGLSEADVHVVPIDSVFVR